MDINTNCTPAEQRDNARELIPILERQLLHDLSLSKEEKEWREKLLNRLQQFLLFDAAPASALQKPKPAILN